MIKLGLNDLPPAPGMTVLKIFLTSQNISGKKYQLLSNNLMNIKKDKIVIHINTCIPPPLPTFHLQISTARQITILNFLP